MRVLVSKAYKNDGMKLARFYLNIRKASQEKKPYEAYLNHTVMNQETLDPSLSNRLVYGNRQDWYIAMAINGMFDVNIPTKTGGAKFLTLEEIKNLLPKNQQVSIYD